MKTTLKTNVIFRNGHLALAAAVLTLLATVACSKGNVQAAAPAMPAPLVSVVKATAQDVPRYLDEIGRNAAFESVTVTPQVGGRIVERHFQDGENLTKGQLLFVIDPRPYKAQVDSAKATLAQQRQHWSLPRFNSTAIEDHRNQGNFKAGLRHKEECRRRGRGTGRGGRGRAGNCAAQPRVLLHTLSDQWPRRCATGGCRKCRAGECDIAALDPAHRSDLRELHDYRKRSSGGSEADVAAAR